MSPQLAPIRTAPLPLQAAPESRLRRNLVIATLAAMLAVTMPVTPVSADEAPPETVISTVTPEEADATATDADEPSDDPSVEPVPEDAPAPVDEEDAAEPTPPVAPETGSADAADGDAAVAPQATESRPTPTDHAFGMVGVRGFADVTAELRTRSVDGEWSDWLLIEPVDEEDGPDPDTAERAEAESEAEASDVVWASEATWVGPSDAVQLRVHGGDLDDVEISVIDSNGLSESLWGRVTRTVSGLAQPAPAEAASYSGMVSRAQWGANESWRKGSPSYAKVKFAVLHHTAGSNSYTRAQAPGIVRGIYHWHTSGNGWSDIGYNILVDRYGTVYEGRFGGIDRGVVGAHAAGWNSGSFGVAMMGNFDIASAPSGMINAAADVMAWKYGVHGLDPQTGARVSHNGRSIPTMVGHRDVGSTACPGRYVSSTVMNNMRTRIANNPAALGPDAFQDVPASNRFHEDIMAIARADITRGCNPPHQTRFCPSSVVTREQMAAFLVRALDLRATSGVRFRDVTPGTTFATDIDKLATAGITRGCNPPLNDRFCPNDGVTRQQMASFLVRGLDLRSTSNISFRDVTTTNPHRTDINRLATAGITRSCNPPTNDRFCPGQQVTREQMAAFLRRAMNL